MQVYVKKYHANGCAPQHYKTVYNSTFALYRDSMVLAAQKARAGSAVPATQFTIDRKAVKRRGESTQPCLTPTEYIKSSDKRPSNITRHLMF